MRGFQPAAQRAAQQKKGYAEGGMVRGPGTGTSDEVPEEVAEGSYIMPADSTREVGEEALERMGARGFPVGGPGAGVPVNLSNGEFKLPPEQVHSIGVQALDQIKAATHQPAARGFAPGARAGMAGRPEPEPRQFFADGGLVEDERRKPVSPSNIFPQASPSAGANIYGAAAQSTSDRLGSSGQFATVPASIGQQPGRTPAPGAMPAASPGVAQADAERQALVDQIPAGRGFAPAAAAARPSASPSAPVPRGFAPGAAAAPVPAAAPTVPARSALGFVADAFPNTTRAVQGAMDDARTAYQQGGLGAALGQSARVAGTPLVGLADDVMGSAARALDPAAQALKTFVTGDASPIGQPDAPAGTAATPRAPAAAPAAAPNPADQRLAAGTQQPPQGSLAAPAVNEVSPGVFRVDNSYGDSAAAAMAGAAPRGLPSAQNLAAANALSEQQGSAGAGGAGARGFQPGMRPAPAQAPALGFAPAFSGVIGQQGNGNMWSRTPEQQRQDAATQATSIHRPTAALGAAALQAMGAQDLEKVRGAAGLAQESMRQSGALDREGLQQGGANAREALRAGVDLQRVGLESQRVGLEGRKVNSQVETQGYTNRALAQQEKLRALLTDPKATETERLNAQQALRAMAGKSDQDHWKPVALQGGTDAQGNKTESILGAVNERTGEMRRMNASDWPKPLDNHIAALKANPQQAAMFDAIYGPGAARRVVGGAGS